MTKFSQVNRSADDNYGANWQKHRVVTTAQWNDVLFDDLFSIISDPDLPDAVRYNHGLFDFNGFLLPEAISDSITFGFAQHFGSH